jgi:hypothetical protein
MPVVGSIGRSGQPSCWDRVKFGFFMGACVGLASGGLFGGFSALRFVTFFSDVITNFFYWNNRAGLRGYELVQMTSKTMVQGAGTFGTFMAIGSGIRC